MVLKYRNFILASMPSNEAARATPLMRRVRLERSAILFDAGSRIEDIYFPETCVVSLIVGLPDGRAIEAATVGHEGAAGVGGVLAREFSFTRQIIQIAGLAHVATRKNFLQMHDDCPSLDNRLAAYRDAFAAQILQSTACNASHSAAERFARWLLEMLTRSSSPNLLMTHDAMALLIGTSRPTLTLLVRDFEAAGLVRSRRGGLTILDESGLRETACPCFELVREVYRRAGLLPRQKKT